MNIIKKSLTVLVILLFISVAIAPTININNANASQENDIIEITTLACGVKGYKDTTVRLTQQQFNDLKQYLVEFHVRLNQTTTREEVIPVFKEAVVELDKYGLLPKGMCVERAQKLVLSMYSNAKNRNMFEKILGNNQDNENESNYCCLVTGSAIKSVCYGCFYQFYNLLNTLLMAFLDNFLSEDTLLIIFAVTSIFSYALLSLRRMYFPLYLFGEISFGSKELDYMSWHYIPSTGWIFSLGMSGIKNWSGSFYGQIRTLYPLFLSALYKNYYSGILGFTGLQIRISDSNFLLGSCLKINLGPSPIS